MPNEPPNIPEPPKESVLWHQSGVAPNGEPFVQLLRNDQIVAQMSPEQARDHARAITEAAEAAEQDAFIMEFAQKKIGLDFDRAGHLLIEFRNFRAERTGKSQGPTNPRDWVFPPKDKMPNYPNMKQQPRHPDDPDFNFTQKDPRK